MNNKAFCVSDLIKHLGCWYFGRITKITELTLFTVLRILCRIKESGWTLIREASMFYKKTLRGVRWTRTTFANLVSVFCRSQDNYLKRLYIYGSTLLFVNFAERFLEKREICYVWFMFSDTVRAFHDFNPFSSSTGKKKKKKKSSRSLRKRNIPRIEHSSRYYRCFVMPLSLDGESVLCGETKRLKKS